MCSVRFHAHHQHPLALGDGLKWACKAGHLRQGARLDRLAFLLVSRLPADRGNVPLGQGEGEFANFPPTSQPPLWWQAEEAVFVCCGASPGRLKIGSVRRVRSAWAGYR